MALQMLQVNQPIAFKPGIKALAFTKGFAPPLAPISHKTAKPASHKMVNIPEYLDLIRGSPG